MSKSKCFTECDKKTENLKWTYNSAIVHKFHAFKR